LDYAAIYSRFITARMASPPVGYSEAHHIVPKCMGGGDDPGNLIRLTPEDHFFAHLLLAKAHGGRLWYAVVRMGASRKDGKRGRVRARFMYGAAKRHTAEATSARCSGQPGHKGSKNGMHDPGLIEWFNLDTGAREVASKWDMWDRYGGCRAHWTSSATGARKTMMGWTPFPDKIVVRSGKGKTFKFINRDGRSFTGTQAAFVRHAGISTASASRVTRHADVTLCGWRMDGSLDRMPGGTRSGLKAWQHRQPNRAGTRDSAL
jgi:hypothetical protein